MSSERESQKELYQEISPNSDSEYESDVMLDSDVETDTDSIHNSDDAYESDVMLDSDVETDTDSIHNSDDAYESDVMLDSDVETDSESELCAETESYLKVASESNQMPVEIKWKNYGQYTISNYGEIKNKRGKTLSPDGHSYLRIGLSSEGETTSHFIHKLVAELFIPNPENKPEVDHIDRNSKNNVVSNLRWVTKKENAANRRSRCIPILQLDRAGNIIERFASIKEAKAKTKVSGIKGVLKQRHKSSGGFVWRYEDNERNNIKPIDHRKLDVEHRSCDKLKGYEVTSDGHIWSLRSKKYLKERIDSAGYIHAGTTNTKESSSKIHRLVALTWIPNPNNYPYVNHKDGNKANNNVDNLEWVTPSMNSIHAVETGLAKTLKVCKFTLKGEFIQAYNKIVDCGLPASRHAAVSKVCKGLPGYNSTGGFRWMFTDECLQKDGTYVFDPERLKTRTHATKK